MSLKEGYYSALMDRVVRKGFSEELALKARSEGQGEAHQRARRAFQAGEACVKTLRQRRAWRYQEAECYPERLQYIEQGQSGPRWSWGGRQESDTSEDAVVLSPSLGHVWFHAVGSVCETAAFSQYVILTDLLCEVKTWQYKADNCYPLIRLSFKLDELTDTPSKEKKRNLFSHSLGH